MRGWASVELGGNVGSEIVVRKMASGKSVADVTLAVNGKDKSENPTWYKIVFFGGAADTIGTLVKKGDAIRVNGRLRIEEWVAKNGDKRTTMVCDVNEFSLLGGNSPPVAAEKLPDVEVPF